MRLRAALRQAELRLQGTGQEWGERQPTRRYSERLFSAAFNEGPEAISLTRLSDGLIVDVNQEWLRLTGFSRAEVIGRTVVELGQWADQASRDAAMAPLITTGRLHDHEAMLGLKDGSQRMVRFNGSVIDVDGVSWATNGPGVLIYDLQTVQYNQEAPSREGDIRITLLEAVETY